MTTINKDLQDFLNPEFQAQNVYDKINPALVWHGFFPRQRAQAKSIVYKTDDYSDSADVLKRIPLPTRPGAEIPHVKVTSIVEKHSGIDGFAIGYELGEDMQIYPSPDFDEATRARRRVSYWISEYLNNKVLYDITDKNVSATAGYTSDSTLAGFVTRETGIGYNNNLGFIHVNHNNTTYGWNDAAANPVGDILEWKRCMTDQEPSTGVRYPYNLTDLYVTSDVYFNLINYLVSIDAIWQRNPTGFSNTVNIYGVNVNMIMGGWYQEDGTKITGAAVGFDRAAMPATIYYAHNPAYPVVGTDADTLMLNYHNYTDDKTRTKNFDFFGYEKTVLKMPKAMMYIRNIV